ncbi:hypothetical protein [Halostella salina]|uniref:hypothetical protein n=1 Tax=Halostella salina TaxID=1547897 RepID=UPI000EF849FF|nr:hypothetical protein [Halostella salina]
MDSATLERRAWTAALSLLAAIVAGASLGTGPASFLLGSALAFVVAYPIVSRILGRSISEGDDRPGELTLFWGTILLSAPLLWLVERVVPGETLALTLRGVAFALVFLFATWLAYYGGYDRIRQAV